MKKKVLALSALCCIATVGAVFAAFTLDPTSESDEIQSVNVDVDLSSKVFSKFNRVDKITYNNKGKDYDNVTVEQPKYHFRAKNVETAYGEIVGATLNLECDEYDITKFAEYCAKREAEPAEKDTPEHQTWEAELAALTPTGYAFEYTYDPNFIKLIQQDDNKPDGMDEWEYAMYKTTFSLGLISSNFKSEKLIDFGIEYQDPDGENPDYKAYPWDKSNLVRDTETEQYTWINGNPSKESGYNPGFYIQPNKSNQTSGIILFTGSEMLENLFAGSFTDAAAVEECEKYLNSEDSGKLVKNFALKIKATEYFRVDQYNMNHYSLEYSYKNNDSALLTPRNRYSFDFTIDDEVDQMFKDGFEFDKFAIFSADDNTSKIPLISTVAQDQGDASSLGLKVTLDSQNSNGVTDITRFFKYGVDKTDNDHFSTIYYDNTVTNDAGLLPVKGDKISFYFVFQNSKDSSALGVSWNKAVLNLVKPIKLTSTLTDAGAGTYTFSTEESLSMAKGDIYRFVAEANENKYFDTFSLFSDETTLLQLTDKITSIYIIDFSGGLQSIGSELYSFKDGSIKFNDEAIRGQISIKTGYKYAVDIRNDEETPLAVKKATLTTAAIPVNYAFGDFVPGASVLSTGSFPLKELSPEQTTINTGTLLSFTCPIQSKDLWDTMEAYQTDDKGYTAKLKFGLVDADTNPVSLDDSLDDLIVKRVNKERTKEAPDTNYYEYDGANKVITTKAATSDTYLKGWTNEYSLLIISFTYKGAKVTLQTANLTLEIVQ